MATNWIGNSGIFWDQIGNWDNGLPGTVDAEDVVIGGSPITQLRFLSGTVAINRLNATGRFDLLTGATLLINTAGTLQNFVQSGGTLGGAGTVNILGTTQWNSGLQQGSGVTNFDGLLLFGMDGTSPRANVNGKRILNINAGAVWDSPLAGFLDATDSPVINNNSGSVFDIRNDSGSNGSFSTLSRIGGTGIFNNQAGATFHKSGGTGTFLMTTVFNNDGSTLVDSGTLRLAGGGTHTGTFSGKGSVDFSGGTHRLTDGSSVTTGTVVTRGIFNLDIEKGAVFNPGNVDITNGVVSVLGAGSQATTKELTQSNGAIAGEGNFIIDGPFNWLGGSHNGTGSTVVNGLLTLDGSNHFLGQFGSGEARTLELNGGATLISANANIAVSDGSVINNNTGSIFDVQTDNGQLNSGNRIGAGVNTGFFNNQTGATVLKSGGSGALIVGTEFNNLGLVEVQRGRLSFANTVNQTAGEFRLNGGEFAFIGIQKLGLEGGTVTGAGTLAGDVENSGGTLTPGLAVGEIGTLQITENYTETDAARVAIDIGSLGHDAIAIDGQARLDGTLTVNLVNGFTPVLGEAFEVVTFAVGTDISAAAADLTFVGLGIEPGLALNPVFDADSLTLVVEEVPALTLEVNQSSISENGGSATGVITRLAGTSGDLVITLASDDASKATVPTTVTILDGETSATFEITGVDDAIADGTHTVSLTANANGFDPAIAALDITDDDVPSLTVSIDSTSISEAVGTATGTVTRNTGVVGDLVVNLTSDDPTEASVPVTVTILDGQSSVEFTITGVDDESVDGDSSVLITASANGLSAGSDRVEVIDDDSSPPIHSFNFGMPFLSQIGEDIDGEATGDQSGRSVSLSADGKTVAIGAPFNDENGNSSGHVRIYQNIAGDWQQIGQDIDGEMAEDGSGANVSLSANGKTIAIISPFNSEEGSGNGFVRIYQNIDNDWQQVGQSIADENEGDFSEIGFRGNFISMSASGHRVAIGAPSNDGNGVGSGHVRIYQNVNGNWQQVGQDIDGERSGDNSGIVALSADGNTVAIGAEDNSGNGFRSGHVRIYQNIDGDWQQFGPDIDGEREGDSSGVVALSADGNTVAIGAIRNRPNGFFVNNNGHVRVYRNIDGDWQQVGSDIDGEFSGDFSGRSISLSADGQTLAIGARLNDGNGNSSGHVRIYQNIDGDWQQFGPDIDGESRGDESGFSVSLSADGSTLAIGAPLNVGTSGRSGHVRVFSLRPSFTTPEDIPIALTGIQVTDIDDNVVSSQMTVENGFLTLDLSGGASISAGSNRSDSITIEGTQVEVNAALATLTYQGNLDFNGEDTLTLTSTDTEGLTDTDAIAITVLPVDDPITLEFDTRSISENGGNAEGTVRIESPKTNDVVITLVSGDRDKIDLPTTVTIPAGETSVTFKVTGIDNAIASGNQDLSIVASSDGFAEAEAILRLVDDEEPSLTLTVDSTSLSENGGTTLGTVTRNTGTVGTVTVNLNSSDTSEVIVPDTVTIQPGRDSARFLITGIDDPISDGTQTISITADAPGFEGNKVFLDVIDDETPTLTLTVDVRSISENNGIARGTLTRNTGTAGDLSIKLSSSDTTEALVPETVVILDGQDSITFSIQAVDDAIVDGFQDVTLRAIADGFPEISVPIRITDDDVATLTLSTDVTSISENGGNAIGRVTRNTETSGDLVVTLSSDDPSEATLPATVTILDGQASAEFNIRGLDDAIVDGTQTIAITVASDSFANGRQRLDVIDDDRPTLTVSIDPDSILENGGSAIGTVTRNTETSENLLVMLAVDDPSEAFIPAMVIIPRGQDSVDFIVTGVDDAIADGNQLVTITASADQSDNDTTLISFQEGSDTVVVLDDEVPELSLIITPNTISENGGQAQATVARNTSTNGDLEVSLESLDLTEATVPISVTIPNGQSSASFGINAVDDAIADGTQTVEISASALDFIEARAATDVTDDEIPMLTVVIAPTPISENGGTLEATVTRNTGTTGDLVVSLSSNDIGEAIAPTTVTIPDGLNFAVFTITGVDDAIVDGTQPIRIEATADGFRAGTGSIEVLDDDVPELRIAIAPNSINENNGIAIGTINRNTGSQGDLLISLRSSDEGEAIVPSTVLIPDGTDFVEFEVLGIDDEIPEVPQSVVISAIATGFTEASQTLTVLDDEIAALDLKIDFDAISEDGTATGTVTRNTESIGDLGVNLTSRDISEATVPAIIVIPDGEESVSFSLRAVDDNRVDGNQLVTVEATAPDFLSGFDAIEIIDTDIVVDLIPIDAYEFEIIRDVQDSSLSGEFTFLTDLELTSPGVLTALLGETIIPQLDFSVNPENLPPSAQWQLENAVVIHHQQSDTNVNGVPLDTFTVQFDAVNFFSRDILDSNQSEIEIDVLAGTFTGDNPSSFQLVSNPSRNIRDNDNPIEIVRFEWEQGQDSQGLLPTEFQFGAVLDDRTVALLRVFVSGESVGPITFSENLFSSSADRFLPQYEWLFASSEITSFSVVDDEGQDPIVLFTLNPTDVVTYSVNRFNEEDEISQTSTTVFDPLSNTVLSGAGLVTDGFLASPPLSLEVTNETDSAIRLEVDSYAFEALRDPQNQMLSSEVTFTTNLGITAPGILATLLRSQTLSQLTLTSNATDPLESELAQWQLENAVVIHHQQSDTNINGIPLDTFTVQFDTVNFFSRDILDNNQSEIEIDVLAGTFTGENPRSFQFVSNPSNSIRDNDNPIEIVRFEWEQEQGNQGLLPTEFQFGAVLDERSIDLLRVFVSGDSVGPITFAENLFSSSAEQFLPQYEWLFESSEITSFSVVDDEDEEPIVLFTLNPTDVVTYSVNRFNDNGEISQTSTTVFDPVSNTVLSGVGLVTDGLVVSSPPLSLEVTHETDSAIRLEVDSYAFEALRDAQNQMLSSEVTFTTNLGITAPGILATLLRGQALSQLTLISNSTNPLESELAQWQLENAVVIHHQQSDTNINGIPLDTFTVQFDTVNFSARDELNGNQIEIDLLTPAFTGENPSSFQLVSNPSRSIRDNDNPIEIVRFEWEQGQDNQGRIIPVAFQFGAVLDDRTVDLLRVFVSGESVGPITFAENLFSSSADRFLPQYEWLFESSEITSFSVVDDEDEEPIVLFTLNPTDVVTYSVNRFNEEDEISQTSTTVFDPVSNTVLSGAGLDTDSPFLTPPPLSLRFIADNISVNVQPTAIDDEVSTTEDDAIAIVPITNDLDPDPNTALSIQRIETTDTKGSVTLNAEGTGVLYDPVDEFDELNVGDTQIDSFTYTITDGNGGTDTATVFVTIEGVNDAPIARNDLASTEFETPITIEVTANDTDVDSRLDLTSLTLASPPNNGSVTQTLEGRFIYTPASGFVGADSFTYTLADVEGAVSNAATVTVNVSPANALSLTLEPESISENGGIAIGTVFSNRTLDDDLRVTLVSSDDTEATVPDTIIILKGENSATFEITGIDDAILDGTQLLRINASAPDFIEAEALFEVTDDDVPALSLVIDRDRISENNDAARGILSRNTETIGDLVVTLSSSDTSEASVNATVTIPNGEKTVVFAIEGVDDAIADGPQTVTITAQTAGFTPATQTLDVTDDEVPALDFTIESPTISENGGVTRGIITRNTDSTDALVVNLGGETSDEVNIPTTVTLPAGQRSASFLISANDDAIADGDQTVTISASATGFIGALNSVTVTDDEVPTLSIAIPRPRLREKGEITIGTVFRNTVIGGGLPTDLGNTPINTDPFGNPSSNTSEDLVVTLTSSDTTEAIVPETVVILAGQSSATFEIRPGDDLILDGPQQAIITASAPGFVSGQNQVSVADNETLETIDGNGDGIPDGNQDNVVSLLQLDNRNSEEDVLTLSGPDNIVLSNVSIRPNPAADAPDNPDFIADFPLGYLSFEVENVTIGDPFTLRLQLPDQFNTKGIDIDTYWKYGPTPDNPVDHWYEFLFDGTTGAEFFDLDNDDVTDEILLHFLDGQRGDSDLTKNGTILDPGAPGVITNQAPNADNDTYTSTLFDAPLTVNALDGVLNGDTDPDGDLLSAKLETSTTQGIIQLDDDGFFTYIPKAGFVGIDSFTYTAFDGFQSSETAHVSIMVNALPEVPSNAMQGTNRSEKLRGTKGSDFLVGRDGSDRIFGRQGNDTISGGAGRDYIKGNKGNDLIDGGADDDVIKGGKGNDSILGGAGNDYIKGQKGHDLLIGGDGHDFLKGQKGNDTLIGGAGDDTLRGGRGSDIYVLSPESGLDRFEKFKLGDDKIGLADGLTFGALTVETQGKSSNLFLENELLAVVQLRGRGTLTVAEYFIAYNP